ncbi:hypothetical protein GCM10019059_36540 [Camelimonas fluminis]|nr:hypothetical protein GCM10019059_36540 [Camelimonas fluminis]
MRTTTTNLDPIAILGLEAVPFMPRGQFLAMLRRTGELAPETPQQRKARRDARAEATKEQPGLKLEANPRKVYDTPYLTRGQWFKMMRETGQLQPKPRAPKVETVAA